MYKVINPPPGAAYLHLRFLCTQIYSSPCFSSFFSGNSETVGPFWVLKYHLLFLTICIIFGGKQAMPDSENLQTASELLLSNHSICDPQRKEAHLTDMMAEPGNLAPTAMCFPPVCTPALLISSNVVKNQAPSQLAALGGLCGHLEHSPGNPDAIRKLNWSPLMINEPQLDSA